MYKIILKANLMYNYKSKFNVYWLDVERIINRK